MNSNYKLKRRRLITRYVFAAVLLCIVSLMGQALGEPAASVSAFEILPRSNDNTQLVPSVTSSAQPEYLIPGGHTLGIKLFSDGILVIGLTNVTTSKGDVCPASNAGIQVGDMITHIDAKAVKSTKDFQKSLSETGTNPVAMRVRRGEKSLTLSVTPCMSVQDDEIKLGAWVRDSMAGIGTLTYVDPETGRFGALGHGVNDVDTGKLMPLATGAVMYSSVNEVRKGEGGRPGELKGNFDMEKDAGLLSHNSDSGVFGLLDDARLVGDAKPLPVADEKDLKVGEVTIRCNVTGDEVREYSAEIVRVYSSTTGIARDFMLKVTDEALLDATGGIVQGMSGSPVLQDGKLVGAVTHVLINDPKRGYGIFIRHMLNSDVTRLDEAA